MARNVEREALGSSELVPDNSELRTYNSELGKAGDSELGKAGDSELVHASHGGDEAGRAVDQQSLGSRVSTQWRGFTPENSMALIPGHTQPEPPPGCQPLG